MEFYILAGITIPLTLISFIKDRKKTIKALKIAAKRAGKIAVPIILMILLISLILFLLPQEKIVEYLNNGRIYLGTLIAALVGSISVLPGFIAFPLGGVLRQNDIPYMIIASFTSTLMMVGIVTIPVEQKYLGMKMALVRNGIALLTALCVALITGLLYGELF